MIYSHPNRLLVDHLQSVKQKMMCFFEDQKINTKEAFGIEKDLFKGLIHSVAISHDLGKATKKFQEKLAGSNVRTSHSEISAIYAYAVAKQLLSINMNEDKAREFSFYVFTVVRRHHGFLKNYVMKLLNCNTAKKGSLI
jgi:CRISPR-associated endonuclease/helicase Cas3